MNHPPRYDRLIIALNDDELEGFVREWALRKTEYLEVQRFTGPAIWVETLLVIVTFTGDRTSGRTGLFS